MKGNDHLDLRSKGIMDHRSMNLKQIEDRKFDTELQARLNGTRKYNTFDLKDLDKHVQLKVLHGDMLEDVRKVVLFADEKRRQMEDYRAWRRNRNEWINLAISLCIIVGCLALQAIAIMDLVALAPQGVTLLVKTLRKY